MISPVNILRNCFERMHFRVSGNGVYFRALFYTIYGSTLNYYFYI